MSRYDDMPAGELYKLRLMLEDLDAITEIDDDTRELIETKWPWLISKLPPKGPAS